MNTTKPMMRNARVFAVAALAVCLTAGSTHAAMRNGVRSGLAVNRGMRTMERRSADRSFPSTLSLQEVAWKVSSPAEISSVVQRKVQYASDMLKEDEWRSGGETWNRGEGDCEDFAAVVKDVCLDKGFDAKILVVGSKTARKTHAVTTGTWNGRIWVSSNGSYTEYASMYEAKQDLARELGWAGSDDLEELKQYSKM